MKDSTAVMNQREEILLRIICESPFPFIIIFVVVKEKEDFLFYIGCVVYNLLS